MNDPLRGLSSPDISRFLGWVVSEPLYELGRTDLARAERIRVAIRAWRTKPLSADALAFLAMQRPEWEKALLTTPAVDVR